MKAYLNDITTQACETFFPPIKRTVLAHHTHLSGFWPELATNDRNTILGQVAEKIFNCPLP